jgi:hypothetical protein
MLAARLDVSVCVCGGGAVNLTALTVSHFGLETITELPSNCYDLCVQLSMLPCTGLQGSTACCTSQQQMAGHVFRH